MLVRLAELNFDFGLVCRHQATVVQIIDDRHLRGACILERGAHKLRTFVAELDRKHRSIVAIEARLGGTQDALDEALTGSFLVGFGGCRGGPQRL